MQSGARVRGYVVGGWWLAWAREANATHIPLSLPIVAVAPHFLATVRTKSAYTGSIRAAACMSCDGSLVVCMASPGRHVLMHSVVCAMVD